MDGEKATEVRRLKEEKPLFTFAGHLQAEGYALGWSPTTNGDLVSGDQRGKVSPPFLAIYSIFWLNKRRKPRKI
jgi:hypothetical protein